MKKISMFLSLVLAMSLLAGCAGTPVVYYTECDCEKNATTETVTPDTTRRTGRKLLNYIYLLLF